MMPSQKAFICKILLSSFVAVCVVLIPGFGQDLNFIMEKYYDRTGGAKNIAAVQSMTTSAKVWIEMGIANNSKNLNFDAGKLGRNTTQESISKFPYFQLQKIYDAETNFLSAVFYFNNKRSGALFFQPFSEEGDYVENPLTNRWITIHEARDLLVAQKKGALKYLGVVKMDTATYFKLAAPFKASDQQTYTKTYFINCKTSLLDATGREDFPDQLARYSDYQWINGILFPFHLEIFSHENIFYKEVTTTLKINHEINEKIFYYEK